MAAARPSLSANESDFEDFAENKARNLAQIMKRKKVPERVCKELQAGGTGSSEEPVNTISQDTATYSSFSENVSNLRQRQSGCSSLANTAPKQQSQDGKNARKPGNRDLTEYPSDHTGPAFVLVDVTECELFKNEKIRSGMGLYQHIRHLNIKNIDLIEAVGISLYKVFFLNVTAANNFTKNESIKAMKIKPFIPRSAIETYGVIRGVALYLTEDEIRKNIKSEIKVLSVYRFQRRSADGTNFTPTTTVKIGFSGGKIPKNVTLEYSRFGVSHFFPPVRQCHNCGRLGHTLKGCRSGKRCLQCGKPNGCNPPCNVVKCILCGEASHDSNNKAKCNVWRKENEINEIKTIKKISRKEVLKTYFSSTNQFSLLQDEEVDFPPLSPASDTAFDSDIVVNKKLTKRSFSNIVKNQHIPKEPSQPKAKYTGAIPKATSTPCYEREGYVVSSQLEKVLLEVLKMARAAFVKLQDEDALQQLASLDKMKDKILIGNDIALVSQRKLTSYNDLDSSITI